MANTYVDSANGDFTYVNGGNAGLPGVDFSAFIAEIGARFPDFDFTKDMFGNAFDPANPFIGPYDPGFTI